MDIAGGASALTFGTLGCMEHRAPRWESFGSKARMRLGNQISVLGLRKFFSSRFKAWFFSLPVVWDSHRNLWLWEHKSH